MYCSFQILQKKSVFLISNQVELISFLKTLSNLAPAIRREGNDYTKKKYYLIICKIIAGEKDR